MKEKLDNSIYWDPRHYDAHNAELTTRDVPFFLRRIAELGDPVLELASGTGRLTIPFARAGYRMTGIDITPSLLDYARRRAAGEGVTPEFIHGDICSFDLARRFPLIIYPFNSIAHLHSLGEVEGCFDCVRRHLAPGGHFILDFLNPYLPYFTRNPRRRFFELEYPHPETGEPVVVREQNRYDRAEQINYIRWWYDVGGRRNVFSRDLAMRIYYPRELLELMQYNGFEVLRRYGDYDDSPFESESPKQLLICRAAD